MKWHEFIPNLKTVSYEAYARARNSCSKTVKYYKEKKNAFWKHI